MSKTNSIPASRAELEEMDGYHSPQVEAQVRLNTNESPYPPPRKFQLALSRKLLELDLNRYPDREAAALVEKLALYHLVSPESVFVASGSNEILQSIVLAYASNGKVAVFEPTYALHSQISKIAGAAVLIGKRASDWHLDMGEVHRVLAENPNVVFLCSPNNPTGTLETPGVMRQVAEAAASAGALVVVDEAYGEFGSTQSEVIEEGLPVVAVKTFSKAWSLAGMRVGYCLADSKIISALKKVSLPYHVGVAPLLAAELILGYKETIFKRSLSTREEQGKVYAGLVDLSAGGRNFQVWPSDANFILFRTKQMTAKKMWEKLLARGILVRYYDNSEVLRDCLRVTVGTPRENIFFLKQLSEIIEG